MTAAAGTGTGGGRSALRLGLLLLVVACAGAALLALLGPQITDVETIDAHLERLAAHPATMAATWGLTALSGVVLFPASTFFFLSGALYGVAGGAFLSWSAACVGAMAGYGVGWWLGRRALRRIPGEILARLRRVIGRYGGWSAFVVRFLPSPFALQNLALGAFDTRLWPYALGSATALAINVPLMLAAGTATTWLLARAQQSLELAWWTVGGTVVLAVGLLAWGSWRRWQSNDGTGAGTRER